MVSCSLSLCECHPTTSIMFMFKKQKMNIIFTYGDLLASSDETCISLLYKIIKLSKQIIYSSKKVKDHYCVAVFWKSSPTDFVYIEEQCLLMKPTSFLQ